MKPQLKTVFEKYLLEQPAPVRALLKKFLVKVIFLVAIAGAGACTEPKSQWRTYSVTFNTGEIYLYSLPSGAYLTSRGCIKSGSEVHLCGVRSFNGPIE